MNRLVLTGKEIRLAHAFNYFARPQPRVLTFLCDK